MSKLKLSQVEMVLEGDDSYATIVDYLRLVNKYGTKAKFLSNDFELLGVLRCNSTTAASQKLIKLYNVGLAERSAPTIKQKKLMKSKPPFLYNMK